MEEEIGRWGKEKGRGKGARRKNGGGRGGERMWRRRRIVEEGSRVGQRKEKKK